MHIYISFSTFESNIYFYMKHIFFHLYSYKWKAFLGTNANAIMQIITLNDLNVNECNL